MVQYRGGVHRDVVQCLYASAACSPVFLASVYPERPDALFVCVRGSVCGCVFLAWADARRLGATFADLSVVYRLVAVGWLLVLASRFFTKEDKMKISNFPFMEIPKISVIVAVYRAEAYLHRCLNSLLVQTFRDFEVLLVDDGSPDKSGEICDEYARKDARIRVFHKENGGVSSARQCGIDHAKGEYTTHVDPDDWVEPTMLADLYTKAKEEDADMVFGDFYIEYDHKTQYDNQQPSSLDSKTILSDILVNKRIRMNLCGKLIRLSDYEGIRFPQDLRYGEDSCVLVLLVCKMHAFSYIHYPYYHYDRYINPNSLTRNRQGLLGEYRKILMYYKKEVCNISARIYYTHFSDIACYLIMYNNISVFDFREVFFNEICELPIVLKIKIFVMIRIPACYRLFRWLKAS